jgi:hypothetical protein
MSGTPVMHQKFLFCCSSPDGLRLSALVVFEALLQRGLLERSSPRHYDGPDDKTVVMLDILDSHLKVL